MDRYFKTLMYVIVIVLLTTSISFAAEMSRGLQCPPGWTEKKVNTEQNLIKKCISPARDAFVELYMYPEMGISLKQLLDGWTKKMNSKGMPFQNLVSEKQESVSGHPALSRTFSGSTSSGASFSSKVTASSYKHKNYILLGMHLKGHHNIQQQTLHAMSTWQFPEKGQYKGSTSGDSGEFESIGSCWAWGLWKDSSGRSVLIIPDGRIIFNGHVEKRWRPQDENSIVVELPPDRDSGTAVWSHQEGRNDAITQTIHLNEQPDIKPTLLRHSWVYEYQGKKFKACDR